MAIEQGKASRFEIARSLHEKKSYGKAISEAERGRQLGGAGFAQTLASASAESPDSDDLRQDSKSAVPDKRSQKAHRNHFSEDSVESQGRTAKKADRDVSELGRVDGESESQGVDGSSGSPTEPMSYVAFDPHQSRVDVSSASEALGGTKKGAESEDGSVSGLSVRINPSSLNRNQAAMFQPQQAPMGSVQTRVKYGVSVQSALDALDEATSNDQVSAESSHRGLESAGLGRHAALASAEASKVLMALAPLGPAGMEKNMPRGVRESDRQSNAYGAIALDQLKSKDDFDIGAGSIGVVDFDDIATTGDVRFWLGTEQSQNADMTVIDMAGNAIDVSIRLHGKEAHVAFNSDQSVARDALQSGGGQLKELLGQEGLTLAGMSVGTSTGQGSSNRERQTAERSANAVVKAVRVGGGDQGIGGGGGLPTKNRIGIDFYV